MTYVTLINNKLNINALHPETKECAVGLHSGLFLVLGGDLIISSNVGDADTEDICSCF
jgi:hypothetical protein